MPLPPLSSPILAALPPLKTNTPVSRAASEYVRMVLQLPLVDPRYARDAEGVKGTRCNILAEDVLELMGVNAPRKLANDHIMDWRKGVSGAQKMGIIDAVSNANQGCPTIAGLVEQGHGHLMVVLPQPETTDMASLIIAQAGAVNFYGRQMAYGVKRADCPQVELFGWP